jgi:small subunit ribosomal protein S20
MVQESQDKKPQDKKLQDKKLQDKKQVAKVKRASAQKRQIQSEKKRLQNKAYRSRVRTAIRQFREGTGQVEMAKKLVLLAEVASLMDKGVNKGIFKRNKANRVKSRLTSYLYRQQT